MRKYHSITIRIITIIILQAFCLTQAGLAMPARRSFSGGPYPKTSKLRSLELSERSANSSGSGTGEIVAAMKAAANVAAEKGSAYVVTEDAFANFNIEAMIERNIPLVSILDFFARDYLKYSAFDLRNETAMEEIHNFAQDGAVKINPEKIRALFKQTLILDTRLGKIIEDIHKKLNALGFVDVKIAKIVFSFGQGRRSFAIRGDFHIGHDYYNPNNRHLGFKPTDFNLQRDTAYCLYIDIQPFLATTFLKREEIELQGILAHEIGHVIAGFVIPAMVDDFTTRRPDLLLEKLMAQPYIAIPPEVRNHINSVKDLINLTEFIANWVIYKLYDKEIAKSFLAAILRDAGHPEDGRRQSHMERTGRAADLIAFAKKIGQDIALFPDRLKSIGQSEHYQEQVKFFEKLFDNLRFKKPEEISKTVLDPLGLNGADVFLSLSADHGLYAIGAANRVRESIGITNVGILHNLPVPSNTKVVVGGNAQEQAFGTPVDKIACIGVAISSEPKEAERIIADILSVAKPDGGLIHFKPRDKIAYKDYWIGLFQKIAEDKELESKVLNPNTEIGGILFETHPVSKLIQAINQMPEELKVVVRRAKQTVNVKFYSFGSWISTTLAQVELIYGQKIIVFNNVSGNYEKYVYDGAQFILKGTNWSEEALENEIEPEQEESVRQYQYVTRGGAETKMTGEANAAAEAAGVSILVFTDDIHAAQQRIGEIIPEAAIGRVNITYKEIDGFLGQLSALPAQAAGFDYVAAYFTDGSLLNSVLINLPETAVVDVSDAAQAAGFARALAIGV